MRFTRRHSIMPAIVVCSIAVVFAAQAGAPPGWVRLPAGVVFALFAPGYACLRVARRARLSATSRLILTVPLSFAVDIVVCLILNATPYGIRPGPIVLSLGAATLGLLAVGWCLGAHPSGMADRRRTAALLSYLRASSIKELAAVAFLLVALIGAAGWASYGIVRASRDIAQPFTALYVKGVALETPHRGWQAATLRLGVTNRENGARRYSVWLVAHSTHHSPRVAHIWTLAVPRDQSRERAVRVRMACGGYVKVSLFVPPRSAVYRAVLVRSTCTSGQPPSKGAERGISTNPGQRSGGKG
jgi:uncharacterized membrane protein